MILMYFYIILSNLPFTYSLDTCIIQSLINIFLKASNNVDGLCNVDGFNVGNMATAEMTQMIKVVIDGNRLFMKNKCEHRC